jgi:hypothetical protein
MISADLRRLAIYAFCPFYVQFAPYIVMALVLSWFFGKVFDYYNAVSLPSYRNSSGVLDVILSNSVEPEVCPVEPKEVNGLLN